MTQRGAPAGDPAREGQIEFTDVVPGARTIALPVRAALPVLIVFFVAMVPERYISSTGVYGDVRGRIDESTPMVDARLADGSRVNVIIPPIALDGPSHVVTGMLPYQHPARDDHTPLSPRLDDFSALFIYVALRALAADLSSAHGRLAADVVHQLRVLADVLEGVPADRAGLCCCTCGGSLAEGAHPVTEADGIASLHCIACIAEGRV